MNNDIDVDVIYGNDESLIEQKQRITLPGRYEIFVFTTKFFFGYPKHSDVVHVEFEYFDSIDACTGIVFMAVPYTVYEMTRLFYNHTILWLPIVSPKMPRKRRNQTPIPPFAPAPWEKIKPE